MDWGIHWHEPKIKPISFFRARMRQMYNRQWSNANFKRIVNEMTLKNGFHGIWDDHDCGWDNVKVASLKETQNIKKIMYSRGQFYKHFPLSAAHNSIFYAHDTELARFIFLDNRSYATTLQGNKNTLLGKKQLDFLEEQLQHNKPLTFLCGGLTLSTGKECFASYIDDYTKICEWSHQSPSKVIFLSGDIHKNCYNEPGDAPAANGIRPPFEITSSGMWGGTVNRHHRWCELNISSGQEVDVAFHDKPGAVGTLSADCTAALRRYLRQ